MGREDRYAPFPFQAEGGGPSCGPRWHVRPSGAIIPVHREYPFPVRVGPMRCGVSAPQRITHFYITRSRARNACRSAFVTIQCLPLRCPGSSPVSTSRQVAA